MAADPERAKRIAWASGWTRAEDQKIGLQKQWALRNSRELRWMIDRIDELRRLVLRKENKITKPVRLSRHVYVGNYEDFLKA